LLFERVLPAVASDSGPITAILDTHHTQSSTFSISYVSCFLLFVDTKHCHTATLSFLCLLFFFLLKNKTLPFVLEGLQSKTWVMILEKGGSRLNKIR
jgi:hypothetical protein